MAHKRSTVSSSPQSGEIPTPYATADCKIAEENGSQIRARSFWFIPVVRGPWSLVARYPQRGSDAQQNATHGVSDHSGELPTVPPRDDALAGPRRCASTLLGRVATLSIEMKRELLSQLARDELRAVAGRLDVRVPDRSAREGLIDALTERGVSLNEIVPVLSRTRREDVCRALGIGDRRGDGCVVGG